MYGQAIFRRLLTGLTAAAVFFVTLASPMPPVYEASAAIDVEPAKTDYGLKSLHEQLNISYPPEGMTLVALKHEEVVELWAETDGGPVLIKSYDFCAASGRLGPKLRRGDKQVPEGVYKIINLNDKSKFHLSLLLDYPNRFDKEMAEVDGRDDLGSAICIHGGCKSIGCIALGDEAIEEIFHMAGDVGLKNCRAIIAPYDFRMHGPPDPERELKGPQWVGKLYKRLCSELKPYHRPA